MARRRSFGKDDRWEFTGEALAEGGQAHVHVVRDTTEQRAGEYVVKLLKNAKRTPRLDREIATTKRLHAAGCAVLEIVDDYLLSEPEAERPWYVAPRVRPGALSRHLKPGHHYGDSLDAALTLYRNIVTAVLGVHAQNTAHRDLKPDNILLDGARVVLADLGLTLTLGELDGQRLTDELERIGSLHYTPPEAFSRRPLNEQQFANDAFALGKILYELIPGTPLPAFISPSDHEYDLTLKFAGAGFRSVNRVLRGLLNSEPMVRMTYLKELPGEIEEFITANADRQVAVVTPKWQTDLLSASDLLAARAISSPSKKSEDTIKEEAEQLAREALDVWQKSNVTAQLDRALGVARGGQLSVNPPQASDVLRSLLGGLQPTRRGLEPVEDEGYPQFPQSEYGCHLSVSSANPGALSFRQHWLCAAVAIKGEAVAVAVCVVRREAGVPASTDIIPSRAHVVAGRIGEGALVPKLRQAAEEMLSAYVEDVVAEIRRVAATHS